MASKSKSGTEKITETSLKTNIYTIVPTGVRAAADPTTPVAHISFVHAEEPVGEEAEVSAEPAEPEVISESKADDEASEEASS